jgi:hypothetical protein
VEWFTSMRLNLAWQREKTQESSPRIHRRRKPMIGSYIGRISSELLLKPTEASSSNTNVCVHLREKIQECSRRMRREKCRRNSSRRFIGWNSDSLLDNQKPEPTTKNICVHLRSSVRKIQISPAAEATKI